MRAMFFVGFSVVFLAVSAPSFAQSTHDEMRSMMEKLKLTVNERKTRLCRVPADSFDFLGYTIGRCYRWDGYRYIGTRPSKKSVQCLCRAISDRTASRWTWQDEHTMVKALNQRLTGWANYYQMGPVNRIYRAVDEHVRYRLRWWLRKKHKVQTKGTSRFSYEYLDQQLGLIRLTTLPRNLPCAKA